MQTNCHPDGERMVEISKNKLDALQETLQILGSMELPPQALDQLQLANRLMEEIEGENNRVQESLRQAGQSNTKFLSMVSHELRVPMTSIKGYADLIRQGAVGPVNEGQIEFLKIIHNNVERMSTLITNLSDLTKLEDGLLLLDCVFFPIHIQVGQVVNRLQQKLEGNSQSLELVIDPGLPQVFGDPIRVNQIVSALLDNAHRYTGADGRTRVHLREGNDQVIILVEDNGIGIDPIEQERVFAPFFRSEAPAVREEPGWGLNLALAKMLAAQMGGEIGFESEVGEGSIFRFILPTYEVDCNQGVSG